MHIPPHPFVSRLRMTLTFAVVACAVPVHAQSSSWTTVNQGASWYAGFVDHAITDRDAVVFDGQWRRMGLVHEPQQSMGRIGLLRAVGGGVRLGGGYAYVATAPYGDVPLPAATREHRAWQQLTLSHRAGPMSVVHRYRFEQRWLAAVATNASTNESMTGPWQYQTRARYQARAQGDLPAGRFRTRRLQGFFYDELLMPIGHADAALRVTQNRLGAGVGVPLSARQRLDVGYMNLWNALPAQHTNEIDHTLTVSWVWTATR